MCVWRYLHIVTFAIIIVICLSRDVSYNELEILNVSCKPFDTCNTTPAKRYANHRNCRCDSNCANYGDCCMDARNPIPSPISDSLVCYKIRTNSGYFVIGKCMRGWRNAETRKKCENSPNPQDPLTSVPVDTLTTTFTYKNEYCAMCNNVNESLIYWKLGLDCPGINPSMENYVRHNLIYDSKRASWGVYIQRKFHTCVLKSVEPKNKQNLRFCYPELISRCSSKWSDELIREKCESYTAYLHVRKLDVTYRNVHCAICNNVRPSDLACNFLVKKDFERTSFTTLFDINLEKGNSIGSGGTAPKCKEGQVYDPAFKRCQTLSCGPPFFQRELRDGVCVPKSR